MARNKNTDETIEHMVGERMQMLGMERDNGPDTVVAEKKNDGVIQFDVAPNLSFTRPVVATINGKVLNHPRWFSILTATVNELGDKGFRGVNLVRELSIPAKFGRYEEEGYKFHRELGISIQRRASQICWTEIDRLAQKWGIPVSVKFSWRQNPKAQHPGKSGFLSSGAVK